MNTRSKSEPSSIDFEQYKKKPKAVYITYNVIAFQTGSRLRCTVSFLLGSHQSLSEWQLDKH